MMQLALLQSVQVEQERVDRLEEEELQQALELSLTEASKGNLLSPRPVMNCGASSSDNGTASTTEAGASSGSSQKSSFAQPATASRKGDTLEEHELQRILELSKADEVTQDASVRDNRVPSV